MDFIPQNILIREPNWVGDNVFTLPAVQELHRRFPQARLTVLVRDGLQPLWELVPEIDEVIVHNLRGGLKDLGGKRRLLRTLRERDFDLAVVFPRSFESALWVCLAGIPRRWGYREEGRTPLLTRSARSRRGYRHTHRIDYYYHLIDNGMVEDPAPLARLVVPPEERKQARGLLARVMGRDDCGPLVGLHPRASHGPAKCWPLEYYARLAEMLVKEKKADVLVFGNDREREMVQTIVQAGAPRTFSLAGKTDLKQLAAAMSLCRMLVANDTGPLHLASALGVPVVGLFGSSDPAATAPRGAVARVIYKKIPCSPCLKRLCPTDFRCMTEITPEEVFLLVDELWDAGRPS